MWNQQRLEQMIADGVEESFTLDYKAAGAFAKDIPKKREDIQKDVSAFANSAGGTIIYGIREHSSHDKKHLPERIDPIARDQFSKEWLEHIISGIQPRVQGVVIHPVKLDSSTNDCCYVVAIPQSETIHQAPDGKYYRRYNFENRFMQDYEVREALNRSRHPKIIGHVHLDTKRVMEAMLCVRLKNVGKRVANHYACQVRFPLKLYDFDCNPCSDAIHEKDDKGLISHRFFVPSPPCTAPLLPGMEVIHRVLITHGTTQLCRIHDKEMRTDIQLTVFADEMEPLVSSATIYDASHGWV